MATHPFLRFPKAKSEKKGNLPPGFGDKVVTPSAGRQKERLDQKFQDIVSSFEDMQESVEGFEPERVIVFETLGDSVTDFAKAASKVDRLEWLAELDLGDQPGGEDFSIKDKKGKLLSARLYAVMSNQKAIQQLLALWAQWLADPDKEATRGYGPFKGVFVHLKEIRRWSPQDRIYETGVLEDWEANLQFFEAHSGVKHPAVRFEVELWCRSDPTLQAAAYSRLKALIEYAGGQCLGQLPLVEISYHGVLAELPAKAVRETVEKIRNAEYTELLRCEDVMFFRPRAQSTFPLGDPATDSIPREFSPPPPQATPPVIAVLDGLPLENHELLKGRLRIDDPDEFRSHYHPGHQQHGTAMCSLILHGDLNRSDTSLSQTVYVRPVLTPVLDYDGRYREEGTPNDRLLIDLFHRAIRRLFEKDGEEPPVAPSVKVVNLSFGNRWQPFDRLFSPLARLLDWLAWKYKVLFLISAGNQEREITISATANRWRELSPEDLAKQVILAMRNDQAFRRPYSPAESMNAVTVGGWHEDACPPVTTQHVDLFKDVSLPCPFGTVAAGYYECVKPEVFFPSGRQLYRGPVVQDDKPASFTVIPTNRAPGLKVAAPGPSPMELNRICFSRGTSDATALATHAVGVAYEKLQEYRRQPGWEALTDDYLPVVLKALLVHGATWGKEVDLIESAIPPADLQGADGRRDWQKAQRLINRFIGCGKVDPRKAQFATDERATVLAWDALEDGKSHLYTLPLPASLSGKKVWRRLTITLAWLSPINPKHRNYRQAFLWSDLGYDETQVVVVDGEQKKKKIEHAGADTLQVTKAGLDEKSSQRGTVQHRVWQGEKAAAFSGDERIQIRVNCKADAGKMTDAIPYALAVSLEVAEGIGLPIYQDVKNTILVPVQPKPV